MYITPFITARIPSAAYRRRVWREGSAARHTPIRHQSGRSDISSDRGCTSPGSCPSTSEAPPRIKNQEGVHRIQVIRKNQEVSGRTLRLSLVRKHVEHMITFLFDMMGDLFPLVLWNEKCVDCYLLSPSRPR